MMTAAVVVYIMTPCSKWFVFAVTRVTVVFLFGC